MDNNIKAFLSVLDSTDNSTGGGTASCIAGAMAAGLAGMVSRLSIGKKDLFPMEHYEKYASRAEVLAQELFNGGREDADAFALVSSAYKKPKDTPEEKSARSQAIQMAMVHAAKVPLINAQRIKAVLALCHGLQEKFNANATSDLECAIHLAEAGLKGCVANVRINLRYIQDKTICMDLKRDLESILTGITFE